MDTPAVPTLDRLLALPADPWGKVLAVALPTLRGLPDDQRDVVVRRVVAVPPARLVAGRSREDLARVLRRPGVWGRVRMALDDDVLAALVDDASRPAPADDAADGAAASARLAAAEEVAAAAAQRAAALRERLDDARRTAQGAVARAEAAEQREHAVQADAVAARREADAANAAVAKADAERARAVERERRRQDADAERTAAALQDARRRVAELEGAVAALEARLARALTAPPSPRGSDPVEDAVEAPHGGRRGRPSAWPADLTAGTRAAASWLVAPGVALLVDGYNVTRQHRGELSFAEQRRWLEDAVATLAQRRHVDATIVWDSDSGSSTQRGRTGVTVRFTTAEMTADDELVLHVQTLLGPDDPVVVVTDDRELRDRLGALGVDLLDTAGFTWLLR